MGMIKKKKTGDKLNFFNKCFCKTILEMFVKNSICKSDSNGYIVIFKGMEMDIHGIIYAKILDRIVRKMIFITNQNG